MVAAVIVTTFLVEPAQRSAFAEWLCGVVARSCHSKLAISRALGYDTTGQLNRYLHGKVFPTATSTATIAEFCGVPRFEAFWRGGFYREVFKEVTALATTQRNRHIVAQALVASFPRRGDRYRPTLSREWAYLPHMARGMRKQHDAPELSDELARASEVAYDTTLPQDVRCAILGELCDAWARKITSPELIDGVRCTFFSERGSVDTAESLWHPSKIGDAPRLPAPTRKASSK